MSDWQSYTLPDVPGIDPVLSAADSAVSTLAGLLDALDALIGALETLTSAVVDPLDSAIASLLTTIQDFANTLRETLLSGAYFYVDKGPLFSGSSPDGLSGFLDRWQTSFYDPGDQNRPQHGEGSSVSCLLILVGGSSLSSMQTALDALGQLFNVPALSFGTISEPPGPYTDIIERDLSVPPDWRSVELEDQLPAIHKLVNVLDRVSGLIDVGSSYANILSDLGVVIANKITILEGLHDKIQTVLDDLQTIIDASGLYSLQAEGDGIEELISVVRSAGDTPPWNSDAYVTGICLLAGTGDFGPIVGLLGGD